MIDDQATTCGRAFSDGHGLKGRLTVECSWRWKKRRARSVVVRGECELHLRDDRARLRELSAERDSPLRPS